MTFIRSCRHKTVLIWRSGRPPVVGLIRLKTRCGQKSSCELAAQKVYGLASWKLIVRNLKTNITKEANIMATYKHFKLGNVVKAESNYGFDIVDEHKTPLFSIIYPTEVQAKAAHTAIETALAKAVAVGTR